MANSYNDLATKARTMFWTNATASDITSGVACRLMGFVASNDGSAATMTLHDSTAADNAVMSIRMTAEQQTIPADFGPQGILFANGLTIEETAGNIDSTVDYILE